MQIFVPFFCELRDFLPHHLSLGIIDVIAAEDVYVSVFEDFVWFVGVHMDIFDGSWPINM